MRVIKSVVFGLVSLVCTVNATKAIGKPLIAKRQAEVTVTENGCTAVCVDLSSLPLGKGMECDVYCPGGFSTKAPTTSTSWVTSTETEISEAALNQRTVVSATNGGCRETCEINEAEGDIDCSFSCDAEFPTATSAPPSTEAVLNRRTVVSAVDGDCTAICWDLMPGTECDVQCSSEFKTEMPAPSNTARVAKLEARENLQVRQVREARLARKFGGLDARDVAETVTVTPCRSIITEELTTTIAENPNIMPMQAPQAAGASAMSAVLSQASAAISAAKEAVSSSAIAAAPVSANATSATPAATGSAPTVSATTTARFTVSEATTASSTASETTTVSTTTKKTTTTSSTESETTTESSTESETTTESSTESETTTESSTESETTTESSTESETSTETSTASETITESTTTSEFPVFGTATSTYFPLTGAAPEYTISTGLVLWLLVGLAANVAFLI